MEHIIDNILQWVANNPHWAGLAVFAIAFLESLAIVGLAMPGWLLLVGIGSLIGGGTLNFWLISAFSFAGAALGQGVSYWVGYHFQDRVQHWPWVQRHQALLQKSETFFKRHGFAGILIGQFIGPIRAVISLMAGILNMPPKRFLLAIIIAAMIWAPVYLMPGVIVGAALTFEKEHMWILIATVVALTITCWLIGRFIIDFIKARKCGQQLPLKRKLVATMVCAILIAVISFLLVSPYGDLMLELAARIWQVIS